MNDEEKIQKLAKIVIRCGERFSAAADSWQASVDKATENPDEDSFRQITFFSGGVSAATGFSCEIRSDIESLGFSVNDVYLLAGSELKEDAPSEEERVEHANRQWRISRDKAEIYRLECEVLREKLRAYESQDDQSSGTDAPQSN